MSMRQGILPCIVGEARPFFECYVLSYVHIDSFIPAPPAQLVVLMPTSLTAHHIHIMNDADNTGEENSGDLKACTAFKLVKQQQRVPNCTSSPTELLNYTMKLYSKNIHLVMSAQSAF